MLIASKSLLEELRLDEVSECFFICSYRNFLFLFAAADSTGVCVLLMMKIVKMSMNSKDKYSAAP